MINRLTTRIGQDAGPLVKPIPVSRKLLHTLPDVPGHFNLAKLWGSDKDGMTLESRHLDALPSVIGDWHTFNAVVLSLNDFNGLTTQQRASLAQAVYLGLNLELVGVADMSMRKQLEGLFGHVFDLSLTGRAGIRPVGGIPNRPWAGEGLWCRADNREGRLRGCPKTWSSGRAAG